MRKLKANELEVADGDVDGDVVKVHGGGGEKVVDC